MSKLVTIYGGSGFVGRYIARRMAKEGWRVRVAVRRPNEAMFVKPYGTVGQVEPVFCNIRDDASVRAVMQGADAVVNCVGILRRRAARTVLTRCSMKARNGSRGLLRTRALARMVQISAIGRMLTATASMRSTKALGEQGVLRAFPERRHPAPVDHLRARGRVLQPLCQHDAAWAGSAVWSAAIPGFSRSMSMMSPRLRSWAFWGRLPPGIYELGGPDVSTLPRADAADAGRDPSSPSGREHAVLGGADHGRWVRHAAGGDARAVHESRC